MPQFRRTAAIVLAVLSIMVLAAPALAKSGSNSAGSAACANGGFRNWTRANGTTFKNEGDCTSYTAKRGVLKPVVLKVFARAWTDRNANHTFDAGIDTLIAELVDATGDGVLGAGDNYKVYGLPTDLTGTGPFAICAATTHIVTSVEPSNADTLIVRHEAGVAWFVSQSGVEEFRDDAIQLGSRLADYHLMDHHFLDEIIVSPFGPCLPSSSLDVEGTDTGDATFLDVAIYP